MKEYYYSPKMQQGLLGKHFTARTLTDRGRVVTEEFDIDEVWCDGDGNSNFALVYLRGKGDGSNRPRPGFQLVPGWAGELLDKGELKIYGGRGEDGDEEYLAAHFTLTDKK